MKIPVGLIIVIVLVCFSFATFFIPFSAATSSANFYSTKFFVPEESDWGTMLIEAYITDLPDDIQGRMYILGRIQALMLIPSIILGLNALSLVFRFYIVSIIFVSFSLLYYMSQGNILGIMSFFGILIFITVNKRTRFYLRRKALVQLIQAPATPS
ncbi:hypothetical protein [Paenibacillus wulumuqiensis]|uniref:hypothetical protein n=1 Tax=Paenibacillus wulumuqiensis TaxID=1567107 RepID=UPI0006195D6A|nr:hypothetical protein [Paenibacillus wulumuqiensis]